MPGVTGAAVDQGGCAVLDGGYAAVTRAIAENFAAVKVRVVAKEFLISSQRRRVGANRKMFDCSGVGDIGNPQQGSAGVAIRD